MQHGFLYKELSEGYKAVLSTLKTATSVLEALKRRAPEIRAPGQSGQLGTGSASKNGQAYYDKYAGQTTGDKPGGQTATEKQLRQKVVDIAANTSDARKSDGSQPQNHRHLQLP
jgi:hypothetical protein